MQAKKKETTSTARSKPKRFEHLQQPFRRTRLDHATETAEDYVELIDDLTQSCGEARLVDIAQCMGVTPVTVNHAVQRLQRDGFVTKEPYRSVFLTTKGKKLARQCRERHDTVQRFLLAIGVPEDQARIDAEGLEHHISNITLRAMAQFMKTSDHRRDVT